MKYFRFPAAIALVLSLSGGAAPSHAEILIGVAGPMSGNYAVFGEEMRRGAQQAVDDINGTGGLRGEILKLVTADDACDPRKAVEVATNFVAQGVKFVDGHFCSGSSIPASKIYETAGIVAISPASTNPKFTDGGGWNVFRVVAREDAEGTVAGRYIASRYARKRIAILNDKSPAGAAAASRAREAITAVGQAIAIEEAYQPGAKNYSELALRLRDQAIDVIYIGGTYVEAGLIIRELRSMGSAAQLIGGNGLVTEEFWNVTREAGEGTLMTFAPDPQKIERAKATVQRFAEDRFNPEGATLYAYAAVQVYVQAAEATGGTDSHRIAEWLRSGNRVTTILGEISFDGKGDLRVPRFDWYRWTNGKYAPDPSIN